MADSVTKTSRGYNKFPYQYPKYDKLANENMDLINADIDNLENNSLSSVEKTALTGGGYTTLHQHVGVLAAKAQYTLTQKYAFHGEVWYKDADEIVIRPKISPFGKFIGVVLNDGEYLESSTAITIKYDTPANSGHILNGIGKLANSWQILRPYKDVSGNLAFGFDWMPITTFSEANPTNTLTLAKVDSKDVGLCFPADAELVVFDSSTKIQTPIWYSGGSYDATAELYTASRTGSVLTLNKNLSISSLAGGKIVYAVSGFKPIDYSTGNITSLIGTRGYGDTGIILKTDGSGNILPFVINGNEFIFVNGSGAADYNNEQGLGITTLTNAYVNYKLSYCPPTKKPILIVNFNTGTSSGQGWFSKPYWATYGETDLYAGTSSQTTIVSFKHLESKVLHSILCVKNPNYTVKFAERGYII